MLQFLLKLGTGILSRSPCRRKIPGQLVFNWNCPTGRVVGNMPAPKHFVYSIFRVTLCGPSHQFELGVTRDAQWWLSCGPIFGAPAVFRRVHHLYLCSSSLYFASEPLQLWSCPLCFWIFTIPGTQDKTTPGGSLSSNKISHMTLDLKCSH